jgi:hypothetical protein
MKTSALSRNATRHLNANHKSSGKTPGKPKQVAKVSRKMADIPANRGAREMESTTQGSE